MSSCQQEVLLACRYSPVARHVSRVKHVCVFAHNTMCVHLILYYILHVFMFVALSVSVCVCVYHDGLIVVVFIVLRHIYTCMDPWEVIYI